MATAQRETPWLDEAPKRIDYSAKKKSYLIAWEKDPLVGWTYHLHVRVDEKGNAKVTAVDASYPNE